MKPELHKPRMPFVFPTNQKKSNKCCCGIPTKVLAAQVHVYNRKKYLGLQILCTTAR